MHAVCTQGRILPSSASPRMRRWRGYLRTFLPESLPGMPMFWSPAALASLAGTSLLDKLIGRKGTPGCYVEPPCQARAALQRHVTSQFRDFLCCSAGEGAL